MPELPEVETTRRHLETAMRGRRFESVTVGHVRTARHNASTDEVAVRLRGRTVQTVDRHGKFLVIGLDDGQRLVAHLGMSGRFSVVGPEAETVLHTHFVARLDDGVEIRFVDPRTFGFIAVLDEDEVARSGVARLGPDAWDDPPDADELFASLEGRTASIKALLLDQGPISGLGNIYADEALHRARIHPLEAGGDLTRDQVTALLASIREVLASAIESGGTTLEDLAYLLPDGQAGENLSSLAVYGRPGESCRTCGAPVQRISVRQRSTHFCPVCQPRL